MRRYIAFLRGMNVGGHRITNGELCACFDAMGFTNVSAFLASGNVIFDAPRQKPTTVVDRIEKALKSSLGYEVPTYLRTAEEVRAIARFEPFGKKLERSGGKAQVGLLSRKPSGSARKTVLALGTAADRLAINGSELYWLPRGNMSQSDLDLKLIERTLGAMTVRTKRTMERIAATKLDV